MSDKKKAKSKPVGKISRASQSAIKKAFAQPLNPARKRG